MRNVCLARILCATAFLLTIGKVEGLTQTGGGIQLSGGIITTNGGNVIATFTSSGTLTVSGSGTATILVVGGGGGGSGASVYGGYKGGGGGAGGLIYTNLFLEAGTYPVTVGAGGKGGASSYDYAEANGTSGGNSVFATLTAVGGGFGCFGNGGLVAGSGGSGGGGGQMSSQAATGGSGIAGQGHRGADGVPAGSAGGGGGAGGPGGQPAGGPGRTLSITGTAVTYAVGGAGGTGPGVDGAPNTGNGGSGGGNVAGATGGNGGSGIVVISVPLTTCTYELSHTSTNVSAGGIVGNVGVTTGVGCVWTAVSNVGWITLTGSSSGTGTGAVNYCVATNTNSSPRTGTLTIAGQNFTVIQEGINTACPSLGVSWTLATNAAPWGGRQAFGTVVFNNKLWVMGGQSSSVWSSSNGVTWELVTNTTPWSPRSGFGLVAFANKLWVLGGSFGGVNTNDVWSSNDGATWNRVTNAAPWLGRNNFAAVTHNGQLYVYGGIPYPYALADVWSTSDGVNWNFLTNAPWGSRYGLGAASFNGKLWVIEGTESGSGLLADIWSSTNGLSWTRVTNAAPWGARSELGVVCLNNQLWIIGGRTNSFSNGGGDTNDVWTSADGLTWSKVTKAAPWVPRNGFGCTAFDNKLWVMGGRLGVYTNDVWFSSCANCNYSIEPVAASFGLSATNGSVSVTTGSDCSWSATTDVSWITITGGASGTGNGVVSYTVASNVSTSPCSSTWRRGTITIAGQTFAVTQSGVVRFNPNNGHYYSYVATNLTWVQARDMAASLTYNGMQGYLATITSEQENNFIKSNLFCRGFLGGSDVEVEDDWRWMTGPEAGLLFYQGHYPDPNRHTIIYSDWGDNEPLNFDNPGYPPGEDYLEFDTRAGGEWNDVPIEPYQSIGFFVEFSPGCVYSITPSSFSCGAGATNGSVTVGTSTGCTWTAASNVSWITITGGSSGTGTGTVSYSVAANTNTVSRTGTLTIAGLAFTLTQAAAPCTFSISPSSASFSSNAGTGTVAVTANGTNCAWTATSNAGWITVTGGGSGSGNGVVSYEVTGNTSSNSRSSTITIAAQQFTVNQSGDTSAPSVPLNLIATALSTNSIGLVWNAATENGGSGLAGYKLYRDSVLIATVTATNFTDTGLQHTTQYCYTVAAYDNAGNISVPSSPSCATTLTPPSPPIIVQQPTNQTAIAGAAVSFSVTATGTPPLSYQWRFNGVNLPGETNSLLRLENVQEANAGNYDVVVTSPYGTAFSDIATLTVYTPPEIVQEPQSQTVDQGGVATFAVTARGSSPLSYQWLFNTAILSDATNSVLTLTNVQGSQAGGYSVIVANPYGVVTSRVAQLVVSNVSALVFVGSTNAIAGAPASMFIYLVATGGVNAVGFSLDFDPSLLRYSSIVNVASGASLLVNDSQSSAGRVGVALALPPNTVFPPGTQVLVRVDLSVGAIADDQTVAIVGLSDVPVLRQVSDANAQEITGNFFAGSLSVTNIGYEGDVAPRPYGNKKVTITDWVQEGRFVAKLDTPAPGSEFQRADCANDGHFGNGKINVQDWVVVGRYVARLDPLVAPAGPTSEGSGAMMVSGLKPSAVVAESPASSIIRLTGNTALPGELVNVPVSLQTTGGEAAVQFSLAFDPEQLQYQSTVLGSNATLATLNVNTNNITLGQVGIAMMLPIGSSFAAGTNHLLNLTFLVQNAFTNQANISFGDSPIERAVADVAAGLVTVEFVGGQITVDWARVQAPVITSHPVGQTVVAGHNATLTVSATGTPPLAYRWYKGGVYISNSTNDALTVTGVGPDDAGIYAALVSNLGGCTASAGARLVVLEQTLQQWRTTAFSEAELLDPAVSGDDADPDGDGRTNLEEYLSGTDPRDPQSCLRVETMGSDEGEGITITWPAVAGRVYKVLYCDTMDGLWHDDLPNSELVCHTGQSSLSYRDMTAGSVGSRFYIVIMPSP